MSVPKLRFKEFDGDWTFSKIGEIFKVTSGSTPLRSDNRFFENAHIPWVKTTDLNDSFIYETEEKISEIALKETSVKILPKGTVFVAMYGGFNQIGRTGLLLNESACNQALSAIYPHEKIDSFFLLTYLNHKVDDWKNFAASSRKDPNITKSDVLAFPFVYPSKTEQTKIASFLSSVDEKISQLNQKHELLSQYKQGMMQKLFSQQIRFKADDGSEFGEWEEKELKDVANLTSSKRVHLADYVSEGIPFFRGKEITELKSGIFPSDILYISPIQFNVFKEKFGAPKNGEILITAVGTLANTYLINTNYEFYFKDGNLIWLKDIKSNPNFLMILLDAHKNDVLASAIGSTQKALTIANLNKLIFKFPTLEEQTKIANFLSSIDQKIEVVAQQIEQAKQWKKGLLQQMFV